MKKRPSSRKGQGRGQSQRQGSRSGDRRVPRKAPDGSGVRRNRPSVAGRRTSPTSRSTPSAKHGRAETEWVLSAAARVIERCAHERPAERVLSEFFRREATPSERQNSRAISLAVFAFFRWRGWLSVEGAEAIGEALRLDVAYEGGTWRPTTQELRQRAVPGWILGHVSASGDWLRSLQRHSSLWLRQRPAHGTPGDLDSVFREPGVLLPGPIAGSWRFGGSFDVFRTEAFQQGRLDIQDLASQAVSRVCDPNPGETWWDACAGAGGKTMHLSDCMENRGLIWATDRAEWRLAELKRRLGRAGAFNYRSKPWLVTEQLPVKGAMDGVLVDAPCSGVGTWGRHPDARWTLTLTDVQELAVRQAQLLDVVASRVKLGGKLIYAVCTLTQAETEDVANAFQETHPDFEPMPFEHPLQSDRVEAKATCWMWPQDAMSNGMFIARWRRAGG